MHYPDGLDSEREEMSWDFNQQCDLAENLAETPNFRWMWNSNV